MIRRLAVVGVLYFCTIQLYGQSAKVNFHHRTFWHASAIHQSLDEKWGVGLDFVYRSKSTVGPRDRFHSHLRTSFRPWLYFKPSASSKFALSPIAYFRSHDYIFEEADEFKPGTDMYRSTVQFGHKINQCNGKLIHAWRYRQELIWNEKPGLDKYVFTGRSRLRYTAKYALTSLDISANNTIYAVASDEIALNNGKNAASIFNMNRFNLGLGYRFWKKARMEFRFQSQVSPKGASNEYNVESAFVINFSIDNLSGIDFDGRE